MHDAVYCEVGNYEKSLGGTKNRKKIAKEEIHILYKQVGEKWLCVQETRNEQWENSMVVP